MAPQTPAEKQAQWLGEMNKSIQNIEKDIEDLKDEQKRQGIVQTTQGIEITKLNVKVALAGFFGGMIGSAVVGLIVVLAQKGSP